MSEAKVPKWIESEMIKYWQDDLAKFFPTSKGPTPCEVIMYTAGALAAIERAKVLEDALDKALNDLGINWPVDEYLLRVALAKWREWRK